MGRLIPKNNPKYDRALDLDLLVPASRAEIVASMFEGVNRDNIELERQGPDGFQVTGKSIGKVKNIWIDVAFRDEPGGVRITSHISRAHTAAWIYLFYVGIGPRRVRGIVTYRTLTALWRQNLAHVHPGVAPAPVAPVAPVAPAPVAPAPVAPAPAALGPVAPGPVAPASPIAGGPPARPGLRGSLARKIPEPPAGS